MRCVFLIFMFLIAREIVVYQQLLASAPFTVYLPHSTPGQAA